MREEEGKVKKKKNLVKDKTVKKQETTDQEIKLKRRRQWGDDDVMTSREMRRFFPPFSRLPNNTRPFLYIYNVARLNKWRAKRKACSSQSPLACTVTIPETNLLFRPIETNRNETFSRADAWRRANDYESAIDAWAPPYRITRPVICSYRPRTVCSSGVKGR